MLTLNRANRANKQLENHIELPAGLPKPKFSFDQIVTWDDPDAEWGQIIGFEYIGENLPVRQGWYYAVVIDLECPYMKRLVTNSFEVQYFSESELQPISTGFEQKWARVGYNTVIKWLLSIPSLIISIGFSQ